MGIKLYALDLIAKHKLDGEVWGCVGKCGARGQVGVPLPRIAWQPSPATKVCGGQRPCTQVVRVPCRKAEWVVAHGADYSAHVHTARCVCAHTQRTASCSCIGAHSAVAAPAQCNPFTPMPQ